MPEITNGLPGPAKRPSARNPMTKEQLNRLAERDRPELVALASEYGIQPGRGITKAVMVRRILEATGQQPVVKEATAKKAGDRRLRVVSGRSAVRRLPRRVVRYPGRRSGNSSTRRWRLSRWPNLCCNPRPVTSTPTPPPAGC